MKLTIPRNDLFDAVNKVKTVVSAKSALPILSHLLFEAQDNTLKLSATDLKVSIECTVDCEVEEPGSMTASSQRISSILGELPEGEIVLDMDDNHVIHLTSGKIETKLYSMNPDDFPPIRDFKDIEPLIFPQSLLKDLFDKTSFAICTDQARYNLTGLLFEIAEGNLTVVATDGRRMSLARQSENVPSGIDIKVIIPGKMVTELQRLLEGDDDVQIYIDQTQAGFEFGSTRLVSALIEGTFPNYDMVIPKKHDKEAIGSKSVFLDAVRRTRTMTNEKFNSVRFGIDSGTMTLKVITPEVGEYHEEIPIEYEGEHVEIAFNPTFVQDIQQHKSTEKVSLMLKDSSSPGMFRPYTDKALDDYMNVVMPIRI